MTSTDIRSLTRSPGFDDFQNYLNRLENPEEQHAEPPCEFDQLVTTIPDTALTRTPSPFSPDDLETDSFNPSLQTLERRV